MSTDEKRYYGPWHVPEENITLLGTVEGPEGEQTRRVGRDSSGNIVCERKVQDSMYLGDFVEQAFSEITKAKYVMKIHHHRDQKDVG